MEMWLLLSVPIWNEVTQARPPCSFQGTVCTTQKKAWVSFWFWQLRKKHVSLCILMVLLSQGGTVTCKILHLPMHVIQPLLEFWAMASDALCKLKLHSRPASDANHKPACTTPSEGLIAKSYPNSTIEYVYSLCCTARSGTKAVTLWCSEQVAFTAKCLIAPHKWHR